MRGQRKVENCVLDVDDNGNESNLLLNTNDVHQEGTLTG